MNAPEQENKRLQNEHRNLDAQPKTEQMSLRTNRAPTSMRQPSIHAPAQPTPHNCDDQTRSPADQRLQR